MSVNPAHLNEHFVGNVRFDVTAANAKATIETVIQSETTSDDFVILGGVLFGDGFVRFYGKWTHKTIANLSHMVLSVSEDVTNYPPNIRYNNVDELIEIDYPVKSNEFAGRTYTVSGIVSADSSQARYEASMKVKGLKTQFSNFILTQGGSVVDHENKILKVNFSLEAFGTFGLGLPALVDLNVISADGRFDKSQGVQVRYDEQTGKGQLIVKTHDATVARYPNLDAKVVISSPNVANDFNGSVIGFTGSDNSCEVITARTNKKGEVIFRCGVGYGYGPNNRPQVASVLTELKDVENIEPGFPVSSVYNKETGVLEIRVNGTTKHAGDIRYSGKCTIGVVGPKGNSYNVLLNISHVVDDGNTDRSLALSKSGVVTLDGQSVHKFTLSYENYIYPPEYPHLTALPENSVVSYDKSNGELVVTLVGEIRHTYPSVITGKLAVEDSLAIGHPQVVDLADSNGPNGIHSVAWNWAMGGIIFLYVVRDGGNKPAGVLIDSFKDVIGFDPAQAWSSYDETSGLMSVWIPAEKASTNQTFKATLICGLPSGSSVEAVLNTGVIYPDGTTHLVSSGYNKQTGRVEASWVIYGVDGKHPAKVNLGTKQEWIKANNLNTGVPTREAYNPETGLYYVEFAPAPKLRAPRTFTGVGKLGTGREDITVAFSINF